MVICRLESGDNLVRPLLQILAREAEEEDPS